MKRWLAVALVAIGANAIAAPINLQQDFDDLATSGWTIVNNSSPVGATSWFQGNAGVFAAQAGAANSYAAANFLSTAPQGGTISTWLISPEIQFASQLLTFYTRTDADPARLFGDGLRVLACLSGACAAPSDFAEILGINTANAAGGYAQSWTQFVAQLAAAGTGRIAFEYTVGANAIANYIGIDTVRVFVAVPEPGTLALFAASVLGALLVRRRARLAPLAAAGLIATGSAAAQGVAAAPNGAMSFPNVQVVVPAAPIAADGGPAAAGGWRAYIDEDTGLLAEPSHEDVAALENAMPMEIKKPPRKALEVIRLANGGTAIRLDRSTMSFSVIRRTEGGGFAAACVPGEELALALVRQGSAAAIEKEARQ